MKIAKFWGWGSANADESFRVRGWSDDDQASAEQHGRERAERLWSLFKSGSLGDKKQSYYGDRLLPEPILSEIKSRNGDVTAVVTRNAYGARVLNTAETMFVDIDLVEEPPAPRGFLASLFGKKPDGAERDVDELLERCRRVLRAERIASARIYRTKNGIRVLVLGERFDPTSSASERLLSAFDADEKYRKLCRFQSSYRARLSPKPWRCGVLKLDVMFPFRNSEDAVRFSAWQAEYLAAAAKYRTCELLEEVGRGAQTVEEERIVELHDGETKIQQPLPLA
ncbi:MAG: hypothetical protein IT290_05230 [Deltaproteobacteria bacterium]|nr:hypothetical protein [Deltaproteobacteria bacterium]